MRIELTRIGTALAVMASVAAVPVDGQDGPPRHAAPMQVGAYYYPEQWPRAQWPRDLNGIARLGFDFTHLAEFSWSYLEPSEGRFDFTWLDEAIALAHRGGDARRARGPAHRNMMTRAIKSTGAPMDFISEHDDFARYPFLVAPAYQLVSDSLAARWRRYVEPGGHLVLTSRSGQKNGLGHFPEGPLAAPILDLIGADLEGWDMLLAGVTAQVAATGRTYAWHRWGDLLAPRAGTEVLATYTDRWYAGKAAATMRRLGRGTVTMLGAWTDDGELERRLIREVYRRAGVAMDDLPPGVYVEWRDGVYVAVNYNPAPFSIVLPAGARVLHGQSPLAPAGVLVWR